jgi:molybdate transport system permease protein
MAKGTRARRVERRLPLPAIGVACIAIAFFAVPLVGLIVRAPWSEAGTILGNRAVRQALRVSLECSAAATVLSVLFGLPLAWLLATRRFAGRSMVRALCTLSMVLPPVVGGVALLYALGRRGLVGQYLHDWFGIQLPFSSAGVILAQTFVAMPFFVVTVEAALRQADPGFDDAARTLGASAWYSFRRVTLPAIRPAIIAGAVLSWARAFGEFGATISFAGSFPGRTRTLPLLVYLDLDVDPHRAIVVALLMVLVSFLVLVALRDRWLGGSERAR